MDPNSPYQAPQADLTPQPEIFPRILPAIVGVGATITFWANLIRCTLTGLNAALIRFIPSPDIASLNEILKFVEMFVMSLFFALGIFLLSLVPEETGAKSSFKLSWVLLLGHWIWQIVVESQNKSEPIPASVLWTAHAIGLAYALGLVWGCWRLSQFCQDRQLKRWSLFSVVLCICGYLIALFREGCDLFVPELIPSLSRQQFQILLRAYQGFYYVYWAMWIPLVYCISRALWRINAHAEIEAPKNDQSPPPTGAAKDAE